MRHGLLACPHNQGDTMKRPVRDPIDDSSFRAEISVSFTVMWTRCGRGPSPPSRC